MSEKQWKRLDAVKRVKGGLLTAAVAAVMLGLSERHVYNLCRAVAERGARGVVHGNTGCVPPNQLGEEVRKRIVKLMRGKYAGFTEKLNEVEKVDVSRATVQRLLRAAGIGAARGRRPPSRLRPLSRPGARCGRGWTSSASAAFATRPRCRTTTRSDWPEPR